MNDEDKCMCCGKPVNDPLLSDDGRIAICDNCAQGEQGEQDLANQQHFDFADEALPF